MDQTTTACFELALSEDKKGVKREVRVGSQSREYNNVAIERDDTTLLIYGKPERERNGTGYRKFHPEFS